jgi:beta-galactosidase
MGRRHIDPGRRDAAAVRNTRSQPFDEGWRFWRAVDVPHDWSVEDLPPRPADGNGEGTLWGTTVLPASVGPFDTELSLGGRDTGWFVGGTGWYRKHFSASGLPAGRHVEIVFDGVDGKRLKVRVYASADDVRLLLNGKAIAVKPVLPDS